MVLAPRAQSANPCCAARYAACSPSRTAKFLPGPGVAVKKLDPCSPERACEQADPVDETSVGVAASYDGQHGTQIIHGSLFG